jgi:site-specific DNA-adenine methylase
MTELKAPFPYFGGKSRVAAKIWTRFGDVQNYVEPFFGSGAVLLARPTPFTGPETVNDADGFLVNFWRSIKFAPEETRQGKRRTRNTLVLARVPERHTRKTGLKIAQ